MNDFDGNSSDLMDSILDVQETKIEHLLSLIQHVHSQIKERNDLRLPRFIHNQFSYETEIDSCALPLKSHSEREVLQRAAEAFEGMLRWHHPFTVHNVTPPPLLSSVAISCISDLYNPNCLWDYVSGKVILFEKQILKYLAQLHGWDYKRSDGIFTFGGKATLMYAIKIGINKCCRDVVTDGVNGHELVVLASHASHYTIESVCNLLGIGTNNCVRITADNTDTMNVSEFKREFIRQTLNGKRIACIIVSGGSSLHNTIDPIYEVYQMRNELVKEYNLDYIPHIHVDAVIGWAWLFFKYYDFIKNEHAIPSDVLEKIDKAYKRIELISYADSSGIDFHKTGLCPYVSSAFVVQNKKDLYSLHVNDTTLRASGQYGNNFVHHYSIEHSRSGAGILSAWVAINQLGAEGFQRYIGQMMSVGELIRSQLNPEMFEVLNPFGLGFAIVLLPEHPDHRLKFAALLEASKEIVQDYVEYCYGYFQYLSTYTPDERIVKPVIGFLSNYRLRDDQTYIPALRIYPMSPNLKLTDVGQLVDMLEESKMLYEQSELYKNSVELQIPTHYPK